MTFTTAKSHRKKTFVESSACCQIGNKIQRKRSVCSEDLYPSFTTRFDSHNYTSYMYNVSREYLLCAPYGNIRRDEDLAPLETTGVAVEHERNPKKKPVGPFKLLH